MIDEIVDKYCNLFPRLSLTQSSLWLIHLKEPYPEDVVEKIDKFKQIIRELSEDELYEPNKVGQYVDIYDNYDMWFFFEAYIHLLKEDEMFRDRANRHLCSQWRYTLIPDVMN